MPGEAFNDSGDGAHVARCRGDGVNDLTGTVNTSSGSCAVELEAHHAGDVTGKLLVVVLEGAGAGADSGGSGVHFLRGSGHAGLCGGGESHDQYPFDADSVWLR